MSDRVNLLKFFFRHSSESWNPETKQKKEKDSFCFLFSFLDPGSKPGMTFIFLLIVLFCLAVPEITLADRTSLGEEIDLTIVRYSHYLDSVWAGDGWNYSAPSSQYREIAENSANNLRMQATFATAYQGRDDEESKDKVRSALINALIELPKHEVNSVFKNGRAVSTRSFHEAIGLYLALQIIQDRPGLFSWTERLEMIHNAKQMMPWVLKAQDTENRALLGAAYGLAILKHPLMKFNEQEQEAMKRSIRAKIQEGMKSIGRDFVYREGSPRRFSLHYHLVSANVLFYLCHELPDEGLCSTAKRMTNVVRTWYPKGRISARGSFRPRGIGLQTVFLRTAAERSSGNPKWQEFWDAEKIGRGFINPKNTNRLVWKDDVDKTLNDDYSFMSMIELLIH